MSATLHHRTAARPIRALLIANRGEIAARVARTARGLGIRCVGVYTEHDRGAAHLSAMDLAICVPGYLDGAALVAAARATGADAVHPGYGFLSENAGFAEAVCAAGLVWVGPPPLAIAAMGSKTAARERMRAVGVPVVPGTVGEALDDAALYEAAGEVGYPVLVKASGGGGGKGMRVVHAPEELPAALAEARRLALAAFGDGAVFLERYLPRARHVEVQVLADAHGGITHLWERECSVQRRHQKVIEEAPSPAFVGPAGEAARARLCADAVRAAAAVGYVGAGTVEFLYLDDGDGGGQHWFLEMNTRIQVEHPVTEQITGLDLVAEQLRVAEGRRLDPALVASPPRRGWAMEARIYAEDPDNGYLPSAGPLLRWRPPAGARVDAGVVEGGHVGVHYDPMLAKVVAWGEDRAAARRSLVGALERLVALGLANNRAHLLRVLDHPAFVAGDLHTRFLDEHALDLLPAPDAAAARRARIAVVVAEALSRRASRALLPALRAGWRNSRWRDAVARMRVGEGSQELAWAETANGWRVDGAEVRLISAGDPLWLEIDGLAEPWFIAADGVVRHVHGPREVWRVELLPEVPEAAEAEQARGGLHAPMPGRVAAVLVAPGQAVRAGDRLVVLEAMKMEQAVRAPVDGVVRAVPVSVGQQVDGGALLVELDAAGEGGA